MTDVGGAVVVLLDNGSEHGPAVAQALAEAGISVVTVHGQGRAPEGRAHLAGEPSNPVDVDAAKTMAEELFGRLDGVVDITDLPADPAEAVATLAKVLGRRS